MIYPAIAAVHNNFIFPLEDLAKSQIERVSSTIGNYLVELTDAERKAIEDKEKAEKLEKLMYKKA